VVIFEEKELILETKRGLLLLKFAYYLMIPLGSARHYGARKLENPSKGEMFNMLEYFSL